MKKMTKKARSTVKSRVPPPSGLRKKRRTGIGKRRLGAGKTGKPGVRRRKPSVNAGRDASHLVQAAEGTYDQGFDQGYDEGFNAGHAKGFEDGFQQNYLQSE